MPSFIYLSPPPSATFRGSGGSTSAQPRVEASGRSAMVCLTDDATVSHLAALQKTKAPIVKDPFHGSYPDIKVGQTKLQWFCSFWFIWVLCIWSENEKVKLGIQITIILFCHFHLGIRTRNKNSINLAALAATNIHGSHF